MITRSCVLCTRDYFMLLFCVRLPGSHVGYELYYIYLRSESSWMYLAARLGIRYTTVFTDRPRRILLYIRRLYDTYVLLCSAQQEIVTVKLVNRLYRQFVSFKQKQRRRQRQRQKAVNQQANIMTSSKAAKHETGASSHAAAESDGELNLFVEEMIDQMVRVVLL